MRKRKFNKMTKSQVSQLKTEHKKRWLTCTTCSNEVLVDDNVFAVKCWRCTTDLAPVEKRLLESKQKSDKPAGWRFMAEFVDKDGIVYHFGEEQPKLKGKLPSSDVEKIREQQKAKRKVKKSKAELREQKREERLVKEYEKKKKAKKKVEDQKKEAVEKLKEEKSPAPKTKKGVTRKTKKATTKKTKKATKGKASVRYEKFEEPRIATDRQQIQKFVESEGIFGEHLKRRQIEITSIKKISKTSYAAIDNETGNVKNKRRGYKVVLENGDTNIINITVK